MDLSCQTIHNIPKNAFCGRSEYFTDKVRSNSYSMIVDFHRRRDGEV